jgi:CDP-diacylglycerol--glycerol-3-phosphate 3-phosphatidyltransferase
MKKRRLIVTSITALRIVCAALIIVLALHHHWLVIFIILICGFITDFIDGRLARKWGIANAFGAFFDPFADKIITLTLLWLIVFHFRQPFYVVVAIIQSLYDLTTTTLRLIRKPGHTIVTSHIAKLKTATLMSGILLIMLGIIHTQTLWRQAGICLLSIATILAVTSLYKYVRGFSHSVPH